MNEPNDAIAKNSISNNIIQNNKFNTSDNTNRNKKCPTFVLNNQSVIIYNFYKYK